MLWQKEPSLPWANMIRMLDTIAHPYARYRNTWTYLEDLVAEKREILTAEITLYSLQPLLDIWSGFCRAVKRETGYKIAAQIKALWKLERGLTKAIVTHTLEICRLLGFPTNDKLPAAIDHTLTFALNVPLTLSFTVSHYRNSNFSIAGLTWTGTWIRNPTLACHLSPMAGSAPYSTTSTPTTASLS